MIAAAFKNLTFTADPIASSLYSSAQHAQDVGLLKPVDLKGIYELEPAQRAARRRGTARGQRRGDLG